jgi:malonate transporter MadL subunit
MLVYGVAILAGCFIVGQWIGETLGKLLHIDASVGGVGFAMLLLIVVNRWMHKTKRFTPEMDNGVMFWNKMYIPVIVAMSASQNAAAALAGGFVAILAGGLAVFFSFLLVAFFSKFTKKQEGI